MTETADRRLDRVDPKHPPAPSVELSLITSCSFAPLDAVLREGRAILEQLKFDLYLLRPADIIQLRRSLKLDDDWFTTRILTERFEQTLEWLNQQLEAAFDAPQNRIVAFATYFPRLVAHQSHTDASRQQMDSVLHSMKMAMHLAKRGWSRSAVVELVAGSAVRYCECSSCTRASQQRIRPAQRVRSPRSGSGLTFESPDHVKTQRLLSAIDSLVTETSEMAKSEGLSDVPWSYAFEVEPGRSFALNSTNMVEKFLAGIKDTPIEKHVGINLDIPHFYLSEIDTDFVERHVGNIAHCHVADHAQVHTKDFPVGQWHDIMRDDCITRSYLKQYVESRPHALLPVSNAVSVEIEGADRWNTIRDSILNTRSLLSQFSQEAKVPRQPDASAKRDETV